MDGEAELVEQGSLDRADGLLDADADQVGRGDIAGADGAGLAVDVGAVVEHRRAAGPMAVEVERHLRPQHARQAFGVTGAFVQHVALSHMLGLPPAVLRVRLQIDPDQPQDRPPLHQIAAEKAEMASVEVRIAGAGHFCFSTRRHLANG